jgi:hypothetical protein
MLLSIKCKNTARCLYLLVLYLNFSFLFCGGIVNFKLTDLDSSAMDLVWCGNAKDTLIILTEKNSLYRSDDKGFSFKKLNDVLMHTGKQELEENEKEIGKVSRILESPVDKSLLIFLGTHGINWTGEDCGRKVKALNHGRKIQEYQFHPSERDWGLATAFTMCEDFTDGEPCKIYKELFLTKDLGVNWVLLGSYIYQFGWGAVDESHIKAGIPKERILITTEPRAKGHQKHGGWSYKIDFYYSDDLFRTIKIGVHKGNRFLLTKDYLYVAQVVDQDTQEVNLLVSKSTSKYYRFNHVNVYSNRLTEHSYSFLDTSEQTVFLHINHFGDVSKYGHIYISDETGSNFSLSLRYNVRTEHDHRCDFQKVESIEGTYIANVIDREYMAEAEQQMEEEEIEEGESMEIGSQGHDKKSESHNTYRHYLQTMITFNKGGIWRRITAPLTDVDGKKYDCDEDCYLNIHGSHGDVAGFYSVESAAGIVISNGNVGMYLSNIPEENSTFLSRDGGLNWFEIRKGAHIYEIGDHGALIVIADDAKPTDTIFFSWDEGLTWHDIKISSEKMTVTNIVIEPNSISQNFIVYGVSNKKGKEKGIVVGIDFSTLHEPQCRNPDSPNTENSDYETWTPNDGRAGKECLLGKKIVYVRRKREAECYNGLTFERKTEVKYCDCSDEDYECEYGFARSYVNDPCTPIHKSTKSQTNPYEPPENCNGFYTISKGYRKIPGNKCINGVKYDPIVLQCPNKFLLGLGKITLFLIIGLIGVGFFIIFFNKNYFSSMAGIAGLIKSKETKQQSEYIDIVIYIY